MVKIWDLDTQRCTQTLVGHHNPVWSIAISPDNSTLVTGSTDSKLRIWKLGKTHKNTTQTGEEEIPEEEEYAKSHGEVERSHSKGYVAWLAYNADGTILASVNSEGAVDIFTLDKRVPTKKQKKVEGQEEEKQLVRVDTIKAQGKIKSIMFDPNHPSSYFLLGTGYNSMEVYHVIFT